MLACLDGQVLPADQARIPVTDDGLLRGDGVFEVCRLYDGLPYALDEHLERMARSAEGLRLPFDAEVLRADVAALLDAAREQDGYLRMVLTRGGRRILLLEPVAEAPPTIAVATFTYSPTRLLDQVKSLSYGANMLAVRLAAEQGADEALLVSPHGRVLEAPRQSFACSLDGETLVTPPLSDRVLDSITRRRMLETGLVREESIRAEDLPSAAEALLAGTTREIVPIHAIDGTTLPQAPGPLTRALAERVHEAILAGIEAARA